MTNKTDAELKNPEEFRRQFLGDFKVDNRQIALDEKLAEYYKATPSEMGNQQALFYWRKFTDWCKRNGYSVKEVVQAKKKTSGALPMTNKTQWQTMDTAPKDGTNIIGLYDEGESGIFWSERPVCMLGSRCGGFPAGWATDGSDCDYNLPLEEPLKWRESND